MKHATPIALDALEPLLEQVRSLGRLTELPLVYGGSAQLCPNW